MVSFIFYLILIIWLLVRSPRRYMIYEISMCKNMIRFPLRWNLEGHIYLLTVLPDYWYYGTTHPMLLLMFLFACSVLKLLLQSQWLPVQQSLQTANWDSLTPWLTENSTLLTCQAGPTEPLRVNSELETGGNTVIGLT